MVYAWLPKPYAGSFPRARFSKRSDVLRFMELTVPDMNHVHVRIINVGEMVTTIVAVALVLFAIVAGGSR